MTAATETTVTPDVIPYDHLLAIQAHGVFARAKTVEWPDPARRLIGNAVLDLAEALKSYWDLRNGIVPPGSLGIPAGREGFEKALRAAAEDAWEAAEKVLEVIGEHCRPKLAAWVTGEGEAA